MFGLFRRDPVKKLEAEYRRLLAQARDLQRNGDIRGCAAITSRAEEVVRQIDAVRRVRSR